MLLQDGIQMCIRDSHYRDMQDMEFTVEHGKLYMLQTRNGKRTAQALSLIHISGNTQGIAGDDLKAIAPQKTSLADKISDTADVSEKAVSDTKSDDAPVKEYHGKKSTDNLIEKLNRNLAQQRKENVTPGIGNSAETGW